MDSQLTHLHRIMVRPGGQDLTYAVLAWAATGQGRRDEGRKYRPLRISQVTTVSLALRALSLRNPVSQTPSRCVNCPFIE